FEKISFRVKKKIFATYDERLKRATIKLSEIDQSVFCSGGQRGISPLDNKWGKQGWTLIEMEKVHQALFKDALTTAYCTVAPQRLAELLRPGNL
ncbi:MAG: MmcQ/YjbR family DNA-binding protein, partial [Chitinophagaceae bacterium]